MTTPTKPDTAAPRLESGEWDGEYIDARGHRGRLRLTLDVTDGAARGKYELTLRTEDRPQVLTGEVTGKVDGERVSLSLALGRERRQLQYQATMRAAGSYARAAMFGTVEAAPGSDFGGGAWIAWRFATPRAR